MKKNFWNVWLILIKIRNSILENWDRKLTKWWKPEAKKTKMVEVMTPSNAESSYPNPMTQTDSIHSKNGIYFDFTKMWILISLTILISEV